MKKLIFLLLAYLVSLSQTFYSPKGQYTIKVNGNYFNVFFKNKIIIKNLSFGFETNEKINFKDAKLVKIDSLKEDYVWQTVWGEESEIRNNCNIYILNYTIKEQEFDFKIVFKVFDDGFAFRYEFPKQNRYSYLVIKDELTSFEFLKDHNAFWIPGDYNTNEYKYFRTRLSEVNSSVGEKFKEIGVKSIINGAVQTPLLLKTDDGIYISLHEAALIDFPAMNYEILEGGKKLKVHLVPDAVGNRAYVQTPFKTPWRTFIISDRATDILSSRMILNLNEPCKINDVSWIKPMKFIGVWWEMHVGLKSWNYADTNNINIYTTKWNELKPNGRHGATTERAKFYIDFAKKHGIDGVLYEGWNVGWEDWYGNWKENVFDFLTPYPDFDIKEVSNYAKEKNVKLIMHHETSGSVTNYERYIDTAFKFMKYYGYDAVKTGYVGRIIPRGENHDGQWMINHYVRVAEKAAKYKIMIDAHEPVRPTGLHRTYPNWLACEAARGNEYNAWSDGNPPEHETILPFTRLIGGPMDYTPGIFQIKLDYYKTGNKNNVHTTIVKQLALFVTMYSPVQMLADLPENYERFPDLFEFLKKVPVDWKKSLYLNAEPGEYITIARKDKNSDDWYLGSITNEKERQFDIKLNFLDENQNYLCIIYRDGEKAHWGKNPMEYKIEQFIVNSKTNLKLKLAPGGGVAVIFTKISANDVKGIPFYK
ncbi:MAG TPA: glycoside hydrolase family 97 protein [Ignavibacteriales bacterium]|nr:glycoside hydrolase family 97 protein [Ignavibacteriales bacterium]